MLDLLFPKRCVGCRRLGRYICDRCFAQLEFYTQLVCPVCIKASIDGATHPKCEAAYAMDGFLAGVVYKKLTKKLIYSWKYEPFVSDLTGVLSELTYESLIQQESWHTLLRKKPIVTSVPLSQKKYNYRGYNHAELLGKLLAQKSNLVFVPDILLRVKNTKAQFMLGKQERYKNVIDAFALNSRYQKALKGKTIIVVDDVATTFATLKFCTKELKRHGAKIVWGVTFTREE